MLGPVQTSLREVVELARQAFMIHTEPSWGSMDDRQWDTEVWVADSQRIRKDLRWIPQHTLEDGFRQMVEWYRSDKARVAWYRSRLDKGKTDLNEAR